jgi:hypothetical protein
MCILFYFFIQSDKVTSDMSGLPFRAITRSQELNLRKLYNVCHKSCMDPKFNEISLNLDPYNFYDLHCIVSSNSTRSRWILDLYKFYDIHCLVSSNSTRSRWILDPYNFYDIHCTVSSKSTRSRWTLDPYKFYDIHYLVSSNSTRSRWILDPYNFYDIHCTVSSNSTRSRWILDPYNFYDIHCTVSSNSTRSRWILEWGPRHVITVSLWTNKSNKIPIILVVFWLIKIYSYLHELHSICFL